MASPNTIARRAAEPARRLGQYVCVVCRLVTTLVRLRPTKIYACQACIDRHEGPEVLLARLKRLEV